MEVEPIWLDRLPLDVCVRIASSTQTSNFRSAITLANASPTQREALLRSVKYKLNLPKIAQECYDDLVKINLRDDTESSDHEGESGSNVSGRGANRDGESAPNLESGSSSHDEGENGSDDEEDNRADEEEDKRADDEGDRYSNDEENNCPHDDGAGCSGTRSGDTETDRETDGRSGDGNEDGSDNTNEAASGDDENSCNNGINKSAPDEIEQFWKDIAIPFQREYAALLSDDVREINIYGAVPVDIFNEPLIQACLTTSSLLKLSIRELPADMHSIQHGSSIRSLELLLDDCDVFTLLRGFSSLQLREFKLQTIGEKCLHDHISDDPEGHSLLAELFPQVEKLALACAFCGEGWDEPAWYLWNVIEKFSNLKEVTLSEEVPDNAFEKLCKMERVTVIAGDICKLVEKVPDRIISITTSRVWTKLFPRRIIPCEHAFELLANCVRLEELNCLMRPGAESGLLPIVGSLRSLGIAFTGIGGEEDTWETAPVPLEPKEGVLLDVMKSAPFLKSLRLVNMRIRRSELREILIASGNRFEDFEEAVFPDKRMDQYCVHGEEFKFEEKDNKGEIEDFAKTLRTAALNNPKLVKLKLDMRASWFTDMDAVSSSLGKLRASFELLQRHVVGLDVRCLKEVLGAFENGSE